jgi:hypothetical protein
VFLGRVRAGMLGNLSHVSGFADWAPELRNGTVHDALHERLLVQR